MASSQKNGFYKHQEIFRPITLFMCGDVMSGRGIDQVLPHPSNPENIACLTSAGIDYCSFANNHVLDWGYSGLMETLETLKKANVESSGAGRTIQEAQMPAVMEIKVNKASKADALWLKKILNREGKKLGTRVKENKDNVLTLEWN